MTVPCALCDEEEFHFIFESHYPIKKQPVIICFRCLKDAAEFANEFNGKSFSKNIIKRYKNSRKYFQPNRCEKEAN